ncbi:KTSC domain-containing protein [Sphingomonas sp. MMS12-HWE2-04]|uniref:KTSC domain-containing protein n=1 Tax=Sphingomonas sp. MMS12-HWE2-04 TaxID=3234199 RepID=UPI0038503F4F
MRSVHMPSSVIRRWDYDEAEARLDVTFVSGRRYSYHGVPAEVAQGMRAAVSCGSYFNQHIRDRYPFARSRRRASGAD